MASQDASQVLGCAYALRLVMCDVSHYSSLVSLCFHLCRLSSLFNSALYENKFLLLLLDCIYLSWKKVNKVGEPVSGSK